MRTKMATEAGGADPQSQSEASASSAAAPDPVAMHHRWSTYVAMACFGLASWIMTNGAVCALHGLSPASHSCCAPCSVVH